MSHDEEIVSIDDPVDVSPLSDNGVTWYETIWDDDKIERVSTMPLFVTTSFFHITVYSPPFSFSVP